jgi:hypothetical protein
LINNYIFRQDIFVISDAESDVLLHEQILALLQQGNNPGFLDDSLHRMSDLLFRVRAVRSHRDLVQAISTGEHTYHSLLKACGEYIGQYAQLPFFFSVL